MSKHKKNLVLSIASRLIAFLGVILILSQIISIVASFITYDKTPYSYLALIIGAFIYTSLGTMLLVFGFNIKKGKRWALYMGIATAILLIPLGLYTGIILGAPSNNYIYPITGLGVPLVILILLIIGLRKNSKSSLPTNEKN